MVRDGFTSGPRLSTHTWPTNCSLSHLQGRNSTFTPSLLYSTSALPHRSIFPEYPRHKAADHILVCGSNWSQMQPRVGKVGGRRKRNINHGEKRMWKVAGGDGLCCCWFTMSDSAGGRRRKAKLRDDRSEGTAKHTRILPYDAGLRTGCERVTS